MLKRRKNSSLSLKMNRKSIRLNWPKWKKNMNLSFQKSLLKWTQLSLKHWKTKLCCSNRKNVVQELRKTQLQTSQKALAMKPLPDGRIRVIEDAKPRLGKDILVRLGMFRNHRFMWTPQRKSQQQDWNQTTAEILMASQRSGVILPTLTRDGTTVIQLDTKKTRNRLLLRNLKRRLKSLSVQEDGTVQNPKVNNIFSPKIITFTGVHTKPLERWPNGNVNSHATPRNANPPSSFLMPNFASSRRPKWQESQGCTGWKTELRFGRCRKLEHLVRNNRLQW